uniref:GST N-terminal domain-containing protein n=1 Tax=Moniliophthora roreri TaxID=221103 RepID=A0A0W0GBG9_MONRR
MSKPVLYTFSGSAWAAAPELAVAELYPDGAIDMKVVNLVRGENFNPSFIKLNPNATLPTLEADGKAYTTTKDVVAYLVENASRPVKRGTSLIDIIHEDRLDPNLALLLSRNDEELKAKGAELLSAYLSGRQDALNKFSASIEATPFKAFYEAKIAANDSVLSIYKSEAPDAAKEEFFKRSQVHFDTIAAFVNQDLPNYLPVSGFIGGEEPGEDDFHLGAWIARIVATLGAQTSEEATQAVERSYGKSLPEKVAVYWRVWVSRPSWKKVYAKGLGNFPSAFYGRLP